MFISFEKLVYKSSCKLFLCYFVSMSVKCWVLMKCAFEGTCLS